MSNTGAKVMGKKTGEACIAVSARALLLQPQKRAVFFMTGCCVLNGRCPDVFTVNENPWLQ